MNAGKQAVWLFVALAGLAFSSWYFASASPRLKLDAKTLASTPDTTIENLSVYQFNAEGHLVNQLETPLLRHTPKGNQHWLKTPSIQVADKNHSKWTIKSKEALSLSGGDSITFSKNVIIHKKQTPSSPESTILTDSLTYFPKEKKAKSDAKVIFKQPGSTVQSHGMLAYLEEKRVKLLSKARGEYVPNHG